MITNAAARKFKKEFDAGRFNKLPKDVLSALVIPRWEIFQILSLGKLWNIPLKHTLKRAVTMGLFDKDFYLTALGQGIVDNFLPKK